MNIPSLNGLGLEPLGSLQIPGGWARRTHIVGSHSFDLLAPADPDEFLNQLEETSDAHLADPYWSAIWSAAPLLAQRVAGHSWPVGTTALELGCGVGLAGLAALASGVTVTFTDYIAVAVALAVENARQNGFSAATGLVLDWRDPPIMEPFPLVLASDVLYEKQLHADLLITLDQVLATDGQCWIGDPGRAAADDFANLARQRGYEVTIEQVDDSRQIAPRPANFQLLILHRPA